MCEWRRRRVAYRAHGSVQSRLDKALATVQLCGGAPGGASLTGPTGAYKVGWIRRQPPSNAVAARRLPGLRERAK